MSGARWEVGDGAGVDREGSRKEGLEEERV